MINYDDFKKVELRVGKILEAEDVPGAEKLLKLKVDIGGETRQLIAGIKKRYTATELVGRLVAVVSNLESRMVMGIESQGMVLAASDDSSGPVLLQLDKDIKPGSIIK
jgi:methionine--tRNA ligase beta chain